ncbi:hypothetical protein GCM10027280_22000 [Micromonospora polyrhachis]|uniref:1,4-dihydroxy-2-naphthoate octaprenyltransferase n=1 Tax=Micromonospora polyrhachis TaxID=1282883 RepID=A0A7W7SWE4_9ACTN|nr:hypothetical protein [Micromonospora polyrhachis]MBB4961587.1 1,4-dihydroxy-2-naphthoate octaprenyltransferase [Micromonospora polyrhachis]
MKGWLPLTLGLLAVIMGAMWTVQGLGHVEGSMMTGVTLWAMIGPLVALVGVGSLVLGLRSRRDRTPST